MFVEEAAPATVPLSVHPSFLAVRPSIHRPSFLPSGPPPQPRLNSTVTHVIFGQCFSIFPFLHSRPTPPSSLAFLPSLSLCPSIRPSSCLAVASPLSAFVDTLRSLDPPPPPPLVTLGRASERESEKRKDAARRGFSSTSTLFLCSLARSLPGWQAGWHSVKGKFPTDLAAHPRRDYHHPPSSLSLSLSLWAFPTRVAGRPPHPGLLLPPSLPLKI